MAVWTGYSNRLTPIVGDGFYVAAKVYRSMMTYLSTDDHPGDWTMPEGLYRSGEFVFKNGARNTWTPSSSTQQSSTSESSSSTSESSTSQSSSTTPSTNNSANNNTNNQQPNTTPGQQNQNQNQNPQPAQP